MRCLSLWQPWASALACGSKMMETRSWRTSYRGPLLIHAAKRRRVKELEYLRGWPSWVGALGPVLEVGRPFTDLPYGAIVGVGELVGCIATEWVQNHHDIDAPRRFAEHDPNVWTERHLGDFSAGRYAWLFRVGSLRTFATPTPCRGYQGLFFPSRLPIGEVCRPRGLLPFGDQSKCLNP